MFELHEIPVSSALLRGNASGDPAERALTVLTPPKTAAAKPMPAIWMLSGFGSSAGSFLANDPWKEGLAQRAHRLWARGDLPDVRLVLPDLFTRFGGSQMIDSTATGPYERHLWEELLPLLEATFQTSAHGACGHSSGGFGALVQAMRHPEIVRAAACHAGDMLFELAYLPDFPRAAAQLKKEGGAARLLDAFLASPNKQDRRWMSAMNVLAMAACYSPNPRSPLGLDLPFDEETCELEDSVWARWLAWDPVRMIERPEPREALSSLALLFLDAGTRDEWNLQWGARAFARKLRTHGIAHVFEEFDGGHTGATYRFDRSLPLLARALAR